MRTPKFVRGVSIRLPIWPPWPTLRKSLYAPYLIYLSSDLAQTWHMYSVEQSLKHIERVFRDFNIWPRFDLETCHNGLFHGCIFRDLLLQNRWTDEAEIWHVASYLWGHQSLFEAFGSAFQYGHRDLLFQKSYYASSISSCLFCGAWPRWATVPWHYFSDF